VDFIVAAPLLNVPRACSGDGGLTNPQMFKPRECQVAAELGGNGTLCGQVWATPVRGQTAAAASLCRSSALGSGPKWLASPAWRRTSTWRTQGHTGRWDTHFVRRHHHRPIRGPRRSRLKRPRPMRGRKWPGTRTPRPASRRH